MKLIMVYKYVLPLLFCVTFSVSTTLLTSSTKDVIERAHQLKIDTIGQVGKKLFFRSTEDDAINGTNWMGAHGRCISAGLQFAKFDNQEEFNYMQTQFPQTAFWVGAQLRHQESDMLARDLFRWTDGTDGVPEGVNFFYSRNLWTCLYFYSHVLYPGQCLFEERPFLCHLVLP